MHSRNRAPDCSLGALLQSPISSHHLATPSQPASQPHPHFQFCFPNSAPALVMASTTTAAAMSHNLQALSLTRPQQQQCRRSSVIISCSGITTSRRVNVGSLTASFPRRRKELLGASVRGLVASSSHRVSCVLEGAPPLPEQQQQQQQLEEEDKGSKIWMSDVVVRRRRNYFKNRQWTSKDLTYAGFMLFMHGLCLFAPATFSWNAFGVFMGLYVITGMLGITLSYHRNLSHKSFKVPKWLEYTFAYCGVQAVQGDPTEWVSSHRYHHQHCDTENDPHTPYEGFWHSHMGWLLDDSKTQERVGARTNVSDMEKDPFYNFIQKTYPIHPMLLALALYAVGGFPYIVWGMAVRTVWVYHITWFVNSASHVWGTQSWNTGDLSRNNWWVALLAFGEGWHNNHHAFEYSARHGLEWWQLDPTWWVIRGLEAVGLATKVKLPRKDQMEKLAFPSTS